MKNQKKANVFLVKNSSPKNKLEKRKKVIITIRL